MRLLAGVSVSESSVLMPDLHIVILAAGKGTRMKSERPKVLHEIGGMPLIEHVLRTAAPLEPTTTSIVIGHQGELLESRLAGRTGLSFATQEPQLGTGHALLQVEPLLTGARGTLVMLSGDVPLLRTSTLQRLVRHHEDEGAAATVLTATVDQPDGYGRVLRDDVGITAIVEHRDASPAERADRRDQQRHLRVRSRAAVRGVEADRFGERAGGVLPAGPGEDLPGARDGASTLCGWTIRARYSA